MVTECDDSFAETATNFRLSLAFDAVLTSISGMTLPDVPSPFPEVMKYIASARSALAFASDGERGSMDGLDNYLAISDVMPHLSDPKVFSRKTRQYLQDLKRAEEQREITPGRKSELLCFLDELAEHYLDLTEERAGI